MVYELNLTEAAEADAEVIYDWYEQQSVGFGKNLYKLWKIVKKNCC